VTLVLGCLSGDRIILVADRRLTLPNGALFDDDTNKTVFFGKRWAIAYTGPAELDGDDTATWIARRMHPHTAIRDAMAAVASEATRALKSPRITRAAFAAIACGWATWGDSRPHPTIVLASNFQEASGVVSPVKPTVSVSARCIEARACPFLFWIGQPLSREEVNFLRRSFRKCSGHNVGPEPYADLMGTVIYSVSSGNDERAVRVGQGLIVQSLVFAATQRTGFPDGGGLYVTPLSRDIHSYLYVRHDGSRWPSLSPVLVGPGGGGVIIGQGGPLPPP
jgi:hypothetical protein